MALPELTNSIFDISCALDKQGRVRVDMACVEMDKSLRVSLILHLSSPELAQKMHEPDGVPEIVQGKGPRPTMVGNMERVDDELVILQTQPIMVNRVPASMTDLRYIERGTLSYMMDAIDRIYDDYVPGAERGSYTSSRIRVVETRMDDFLFSHVLKNPEAHQAIREAEARAHPDSSSPPLPPSGGGVGGR